jgi:hypothetical protein
MTELLPGIPAAATDRSADNDDDLLLTTADVAAITRAPTSTVRYWLHLGCGPHGFRVGRRVLYRRSEVMRWLAGHEAAASTDAHAVYACR